ncbi:MAG: TldD/PmbA family protein [Terriglobia bacterium]
MFTQDEARKLALKTIGFSTFPECQVGVSATEEAYTRFANNGITTAALSMRRSVSIAVTREGRTGSYSIDDLDDASLKDAVRKAEELAMIAPPNPERMPAAGPQQYPAMNDFDAATASARAPEMIPHVKTIIDAAVKQKLVAAGLIERSHHTNAIANKAGLFGFHEASDSQLTTTVRMADGSSSGWAGQPSTRISRLDSALLATTAIDKCLRWKKPQRLDPGNYTVVLEPTAAGDLVRLITPGFSARAADEGRTFLSKRGGGTLLGEKLFPEFITLRTDPFDPDQPSAPWTGDLLPARAITWIGKGVVSNVYYDRYWASQTGKEPTPSPNGSLRLEGGADSLDTLIKSVERGILITHFWYIRNVNPQTLQMTGLTRDGVFLIEKGQITAPVMNFRFLESPVRLLKNTLQLSPAVRVRGLEGGMMIAPALVATDFPLPSISDAI